MCSDYSLVIIFTESKNTFWFQFVSTIETQQEAWLGVKKLRMFFQFNTQEKNSQKSHVLSLPVTHYLLTYTSWH